LELQKTIENPKKALATVFAVVLVDLLGFGLVLPLLPFYAGKFEATPVEIGLLYSIYSLAQLIFSPLWGSWSDKVGRRPVMLISTFGGIIAYIWFGLAGSLAALFLSRLMAGIMGGNLGAAQAYIADVTTPEKRASGMALIGAAFGIGFVMGPAIAAGLIHPKLPEYFIQNGWIEIGTLIQSYQFEMIGFFAALMSLGSFLLVTFYLPETVDVKAAKTMDIKGRASPLTSRFWRELLSDEGIANPRTFRLLILSGFLLTFLQSALFGAFPLFCEAVFDMSAEQVGIQFFYVGLITVFMQGFVIRYLTRYIPEELLFVTGNVLTIIGFGLMGFSGSIPMMTGYLAIMSVGMSLNAPTLSSLVSKQVDPARVGGTLGMFQSISGMGRVLGPTWGGFLFTISFDLPFWLTALIATFTVYAGWSIYRGRGPEIRD
jgi:MFS transporter, DHA1 family, tetracycline resistance protein